MVLLIDLGVILYHSAREGLALRGEPSFPPPLRAVSWVLVL